MRLRPVENPSEPDYPDYDAFHKSRREFLRRMGLAAGAILAGVAVPGCGKEGTEAEVGTTPVTPIVPIQPKKVPVDPPPVRLAGEAAPPEPIMRPDDPHIRGGMRAPCPPEDVKIAPDPDDPETPAPPVKPPK
jgi:hypothetical protein